MLFVGEEIKEGHYYGSVLYDESEVELWLNLVGGISAYEVPVGILRDITIKKEFRKNGIGRKFLKDFEKKCEKHGVKTMFLLCAIPNEDFDLQAWYERSDWKKIGMAGKNPLMIKKINYGEIN